MSYLILIALMQPATGTWQGRELPCPQGHQWSVVTKLPSGCLARRACACYTPEEHLAVSKEFAACRTESASLQASIVTCAARTEELHRKILGLEAGNESLRKSLVESNDRAAQLGLEAPSRVTWFLTGATTALLTGLGVALAVVL